MVHSTVPYDPAMRVGMGYNSFTQELCSRDVVTAKPAQLPPNSKGPSNANSQVASSKVSFNETSRPLNEQARVTAKFITRFPDLVQVLGVTPASHIKRGRQYADLLNVDDFNDHHIHYVVHVLVTQEVSSSIELTELNVIATLPKKDFSAIYGDCFISGFNEGGEFIALISLKLEEPSSANIRAVKSYLEGQIGFAASPLATVDPKQLPDHDIKIVTHVRGGDNLSSGQDRTLRNIRDEALFFSKHAFAHPVRLSPILTKYTTLMGFHIAKAQNNFMAIHNVEQGFASLALQPAASELEKFSADAKAGYEAREDWVIQSKESTPTTAPIALPSSTTISPPKWFNELSPYPATTLGLGQAYRDIQREMIRIVEEASNDPLRQSGILVNILVAERNFRRPGTRHYIGALLGQSLPNRVKEVVTGEITSTYMVDEAALNGK
ncbi:hypothetical protein MIND_00316800 [Mycena indigotica]|uniref:Uncharacterized protein n=1 Tax=Mycena indigotica TaxID=2126181 RepID=A0A8H6T4V5_9AGAR|nr:uncharacterized protein MIND_00316800 [Mycena indigotica]KAF7309460.1 hypothetical protein MIND_00316800 [Mycena indigotica]